MYWKICFKVLISLDYYSIFSALLEAQSIGEARDTGIKIRGLGIQPGRVVYILCVFGITIPYFFPAGFIMTLDKHKQRRGSAFRFFN
jgi:hypothetical protein